MVYIARGIYPARVKDRVYGYDLCVGMIEDTFRESIILYMCGEKGADESRYLFCYWPVCEMEESSHLQSYN